MKKILPIAFLATFMLATPTIAEPTIGATWVMMRGRVQMYDGNPASGWCGVCAEIGEWAQVSIAWTDKFTIPTIYTFYAARLVDTTLVELNHEGADLYILGLWNVYNVTFIYGPSPGNYSFYCQLLVDQGEGTLSVTGHWMYFTVDIRECALIEGEVTFHVVESVEIPIGDVSGPTVGIPDRTVNIWDLVHVAKAYGSTPRVGSGYDFCLDFNFDYTVDIYDLTTMAVNIGESY